jgi:SAM-dependent methyltransferase
MADEGVMRVREGGERGTSGRKSASDGTSRPEKPAAWYDRVFSSSAVYAQHYAQTPYYPGWATLANRFLQSGRSSIVDLGCGPGQFACLLRDKGVAEYHGVDFSPIAIAQARKLCPELSFAVEDLLESDVLERRAYDTVFCLEFLEHVQEDVAVLRRIRPGTLFLGSVPNFPAAAHVRHFSTEDQVRDRYGSLFDDLSIETHVIDDVQATKLFLIEGTRSSAAYTTGSVRVRDRRPHVVILMSEDDRDGRVTVQAHALASHDFRVTMVCPTQQCLRDTRRPRSAAVVRIPASKLLRVMERRARRRRKLAKRYGALRRSLLSATAALEGAAVLGMRRMPGRARRVVTRHWGYWVAVGPILGDLEPDILHACRLSTIYAAERYHRATGIPIVYDEPECAVRPRDRKWLGWRLDRVIEQRGARLSDAVVTSSPKKAERLLRGYGLDPAKVVVDARSAEGQPDALVAVYDRLRAENPRS